MKRVVDQSVIESLQKQILSLQSSRPVNEQQLKLGLGLLESAFPGKVFPRAVIHEFISQTSQQAACTTGFMSVILAKLMQNNAICVWVSTKPRRAVFAPALKAFGLEPHRILFVDTNTPKQTLWALEEALKCEAVGVVVGELNELTFNESRRFQLAVEESRVTGLIHRFRPKNTSTVACVSRWRINALPSVIPGGLPGVGFPRWNVELQKVKNGIPAQWQLQWSSKKGLEYYEQETNVNTELQTG